jgi:hypothetical protein
MIHVRGIHKKKRQCDNDGSRLPDQYLGHCSADSVGGRSHGVGLSFKAVDDWTALRSRVPRLPCWVGRNRNQSRAGRAGNGGGTDNACCRASSSANSRSSLAYRSASWAYRSAARARSSARSIHFRNWDAATPITLPNTAPIKTPTVFAPRRRLVSRAAPTNPPSDAAAVMIQILSTALAPGVAVPSQTIPPTNVNTTSETRTGINPSRISPAHKRTDHGPTLHGQPVADTTEWGPVLSAFDVRGCSSGE